MLTACLLEFKTSTIGAAVTPENKIRFVKTFKDRTYILLEKVTFLKNKIKGELVLFMQCKQK